MSRSSVVVAVLTIATVALLTYSLKGEVKEVRQEADRTAQEIRTIRAETSLLKAEWAYLSRPERLEELAGRYLTLSPVTTEDRAEVAELPVRFELLEAEEAPVMLAEVAEGQESAEEVDVVVLPAALPSRRPNHTTADRLSKSYASMDATTRHAIAAYAQRTLHPIKFESAQP